MLVKNTKGGNIDIFIRTCLAIYKENTFCCFQFCYLT